MPIPLTNQMKKQRHTNSTINTELLILPPLPPIPALKSTNDHIFAPNTANPMPNQLQDKKKSVQEFENEKQNEGDIGAINENKMSKNSPSRILIHMGSTRTLSNH